ncbi:hypothetical protein J2749_001012 [Methanobacterium oryzae]
MENESELTSILEKYPYLEEMHHAHLNYIRQPPMNSLDYLFGLIEDMDEEKRDKIFDMTYMAIINPRFREPTFTKGEKRGDLLLDKVDYGAFKDKVYSLSETVPAHFLIQSIISFTLTHIFDFGDESKLEELIGRHMERVEMADEVKSDESKMNESKMTETGLDRYLELTGNMLNEFPERSKENYELYTYFCENVVSKLYNQPIIDALYKK